MLKASRLLLLLVFPLAGFACHGKRHATSSETTADRVLKKKYAGLLGIPENEITNLPLYHFIDEWYAVPYKYGGKTKTGVDCSGFVSALYSSVYKKTIAGSAATLCDQSDKVSEKNLEEGDLVFFKINSDKVSHVGVYLKNHHFVHASTHKGVVISSLEETYYSKYFYRGGRVK